MINSSGVVGTRELGSNAFNSNTYNNYSLQLGSSSTRGGVKIGFTESGKNYPVELSSEKMFVNVPWTDNNTTYSVGDGGLTQKNFTTTLKSKLDGIAAGAQVNPSVGDGGLTQKNFTTTLKSKLDGIAASATNVTNNSQISNGRGYITSFTNTVDMGSGFIVATTDGTAQFTIVEDNALRFAGAGATTVAFNSVTKKVTISSTDNNTTYSVGDGGLSQKNFTTTLKSKLDGIAASANNFSLPLSAAGTRGGVKIGYSENGKNYPVELSSEKMYVNVPWTDNNTTYSVGDGGLSQNNFTNADHTKLNGIATSATNVTNNSQISNGRGYITSFTNTVDMGDGFVVQDGDGTNVTITEGKYIKFTEGSGIDINFTDTNQGISSDPFDLTITNTITNNNQLSNGAGYVTTSGNTVIGTDSDINTSGATVVDQLNMTDGVIQSHSTRTLTLANLGYTGATNANNFTYSLPAGSSSTRGGFKIGYSESGKNYPVEVSSEKMYVNVPWSDTNTNTQLSDAQVRSKVSGGTGISYNSSTGVITNSVSNTNTVTSFRRDNTGTYRTGNINLVGGTNVSISEGEAGIFTITSTDTNTDTNTQLSTAQVRSKISGTGLISYNNSTGVISTTATNVTNNNQISNGAGYRTSAQVDAAIATVVDSAPAALNTLNELAASLGDDADFAGSVTTSLSGKLSTSGKAADSNLLDGLDLHTGRNNQANKVVRTNSMDMQILVG
jgi:hypothetical protein